MTSFTTTPTSAALIGSLFILPFLVANAIVSTRIEPFFSVIRPGIHTSPQEYVLLFVVLLLMPIGAFVALRPMIRTGADGARHFHLLNGSVAVALFLAFATLAVALGSEIYRCDILGIPNCD